MRPRVIGGVSRLEYVLTGYNDGKSQTVTSPIKSPFLSPVVVK